MQKTCLLKEDENTKNVYINHDLTIAQSRAAYLLRQSQKKEMVEEEDVGNSGIGSGGTEISSNQAGEATQSSDTQLKERKHRSTRRSVTFNKVVEVNLQEEGQATIIPGDRSPSKEGFI